ncbi:MAG TPA: acetate kinase [Acholeplasmataceae bacterium]|nr:acetate kinase [Acholeplasmataceae bacterium]
MKKIMAVNAGSSSLKFQLLAMPEEITITEGIVERIGLQDAYYTIVINGDKEKQVLPVKDHAVAVDIVLNDLINKGIIKSLEEISGVGHRIVQGGGSFDKSVLIDEDVVAEITRLCDLAPLHNPAHLIGIKAFREALPNVKQVAVFDTAFHQTMSKEAYMYAVPYEWYEKYGIRKYGAHGTSHQYVALEAAKLEGKPIEDLKIVTLHLGNGASISAIKGGKCIDTSMGLTPLEGIPMGTRSGNIDPTVVEYICNKENLSVSEVLDALNKKSGYLGVSGVSNDSRDLEKCMYEGNERCKLALDIQYKRIADYIGSYYVYLGGIDVIVFTAGIGENSERCRSEVLRRISVLGVELDEEANKVRGKAQLITKPTSKIRAYLIPTNEEIVIARDTLKLISQ